MGLLSPKPQCPIFDYSEKVAQLISLYGSFYLALAKLKLQVIGAKVISS
jgi:hypothetical protein